MKKRKIIMCEKCLKVDTVYNKINWECYSTYNGNYYSEMGKWFCRDCFREIDEWKQIK